MITTYQCPNCGGQREFDAHSGTSKCLQCESVFDIPQYEMSPVHPLSSYHENVIPSKPEDHMLQCHSCGAVIELDETETSTDCPYCASKIVLSDKQVSKLPIDGIKPFSISKKEVPKIFKDWISKKFFAPGALKNLYEQGKILGMYLPYWLFYADAECRYRGEGGTVYEERYKDSEGNWKTRKKTKWEPVSGYVRQKFRNLLIRASKAIKNHYIVKGLQFKNFELKGYHPDYLAGYSSEIYSIPIDDAMNEAKKEMESELKDLAKKDILRSYDKAANIKIYPQYSNEGYRHVLLPVYSTAYQYNNKVYNVLINGETGKVEGEYPKSAVKIILTILVVIAVIVGIYFLIQHFGGNS